MGRQYLICELQVAREENEKLLCWVKKKKWKKRGDEMGCEPPLKLSLEGSDSLVSFSAGKQRWMRFQVETALVLKRASLGAC